MTEPRSPEGTDLHQLGLMEALRAMASGRLDRAAYVKACWERARSLDADLRAFAYLPPEPPAAADAGPLAGIPVGLKDIIDTADMPTENGSPIFAGRVPDADAFVAARLKSLGASILGKTVTTEFASRDPGPRPTRNPWDLERTPGGSSSGSAAAVAAGIVPLALGSQTVGSTVRPSAYCGVVGYKPSYGAVPRSGIFRSAGSLDHVGIITRSVEDAAFALSMLATADESDRHGVPLPTVAVPLQSGLAPSGKPRLGLVRTPFWDRLEPAQQGAVESAATAFTRAGAEVEEITMSPAFDPIWDACMRLFFVEAGANFAPWVARYPGDASEHLKEVVESGARTSAFDYLDLLSLQRRLRTRFAEPLSGFDALLCAPALGEAPIGSFTGDVGFVAPWTFLGVPSLTIPVTRGPAGLPLGIQLVAPYRQDWRLLAVARWCEAVAGFRMRAA